MATPRLLLVEFLSADRFSQYRSELYPFLQGYAKGRDIAVRWIAFGLGPEDQAAGRHVVALGAEDTARLLSEIAAFAPTHVLCNEHLERRFRSVLEGSRDGIVVATTERGGRDLQSLGHVHEWLGLPLIETGLLLDEAHPDYHREAANPLAGSLPPVIQILAGPACLYRKPLRRNPQYQRLGPRLETMSAACAFCDCPTDAKYTYATPPVELVLKQIHGAIRTRPAHEKRASFLMQGVVPFLVLGRLAERILSDALPPCDLMFGSRIDELIRMRAVVERVLPRFERAGHSIHIHNMGIENFSEAENARLNKGIEPGQVAEAAALLARWEAQFPGTFSFSKYGGFGFITFTPWTTLDDLEQNVRVAEQLGIVVGELFATSRLILLPGLPITELARHDGLLAPRFEDPAAAAMVDGGCLNSWDQVEVPWRFLHSEVATIYAIVLRAGIGPGSRICDPLRQETRDALARIPADQREPCRVLPALLRAARARPGASAGELLAWLVETFGETSGATRHGELWRAVAARTQVLLGKLASGPGNPLRGYRAESVQLASPNDGELAVTLRGGDRRIELLIRGAGGFESPYLRTERLSITYRAATPIDTPEKVAIVKLVAAAMEKYALPPSR